nr:signal recognition particle-docking protein FtsY [Lachnospiraceae bacterium]
KETVKRDKISDPKECRQVLIDNIKSIMDLGEISYDFEEKTSVVFVVGVNGVGKTTTIGKLSSKIVLSGKKVVIAAADTFRAAAQDQLATWAERSGATLICGAEGADPASVVFDAISSAKAKKADVLMIDTAGRLHNKKNLMAELEKMNRIIDREYPDAIKETLIVLDATTGQNALAQAREFKEAADVTGAVLTKMDGSAKGGIAVAISGELKIPIKYIGVGEKIEDLQKFDADRFVDALFATESEEEDENAGKEGF